MRAPSLADSSRARVSAPVRAARNDGLRRALRDHRDAQRAPRRRAPPSAPRRRPSCGGPTVATGARRAPQHAEQRGQGDAGGAGRDRRRKPAHETLLSVPSATKQRRASAARPAVCSPAARGRGRPPHAVDGNSGRASRSPKFVPPPRHGAGPAPGISLGSAPDRKNGRVAHLDRVPASEAEGNEFESHRAHN